SELARLALAIAGSDGHIDPAEIKAIQKLYATLGLDADGIYSDLHALAASSGPVVVQQSTTGGTEYAIPAKPEPQPALTTAGAVDLDHDRIAAIMSDTARVSGVLHSIFSDDAEPDPEPEAVDPVDVAAAIDSGRFEGLDARHRTLVQELLQSESWTEDEFATLSKQFGLMPSGALEAVNEWAYERFDDALLDEDGDLSVNREIAAKLAA
ncbi:tellurite resistance TerB C-terminal domain-containing protein, partial [Thalassobaculum sp.]|uniref:tellurite resistance TerB C-terminal domain-containing protein n=1 Tax=Thalassobaculum sp. TaxID=2022740 RepID=UPI0032EDB7F3